MRKLEVDWFIFRAMGREGPQGGGWILTQTLAEIGLTLQWPNHSANISRGGGGGGGEHLPLEIVTMACLTFCLLLTYRLIL